MRQRRMVFFLFVAFIIMLGLGLGIYLSSTGGTTSNCQQSLDAAISRATPTDAQRQYYSSIHHCGDTPRLLRGGTVSIPIRPCGGTVSIP